MYSLNDGGKTYSYQEFLDRPTLRADWWHNDHPHVLGGRDLQHPSHGTWLALTKQGRLAVLTNFREEDAALVKGSRSRGEIAKSFLATAPDSDETPSAFAERLVEQEGVEGVGGFSLIFNRLNKKREPLGIVSNRTTNLRDIVWVGPGSLGETFGQTCALSNSTYGDRAWPKVVHGEQLLRDLLDEEAKGDISKDQLLDRCFGILSTDTLPKYQGEDWQTYTRSLRHSIFIPPVQQSETQNKPADELARAESDEALHSHGKYGTQKQTVILVDQQGRATFVERTLFAGTDTPMSIQDRDRRFEFSIDGWET